MVPDNAVDRDTTKGLKGLNRLLCVGPKLAVDPLWCRYPLTRGRRL